MKKILYVALVVIMLFLGRGVFAGAENEAKNGDILFFYSHFCPHCEKEEVFLKKMEEKYPRLEINRYDIAGDPENIRLLKEKGDFLGIDIAGVPVLIVGEKGIIGYQNEKSTGVEIEGAFLNFLEGANIAGDTQKIKIPFFGEKDIKSFSLPVLTMIIGVLDGFNPCAMWVLLFLISLLLGMSDRRKMWILGSVFIIVSGFIYFLFLSAWLNLFLFIGFIAIIRIIIGLVALCGGAYHIKEYFTNKNATCKVTGGDRQQKVFAKLKQIVSNDNFVISLVGIMFLAIAVNLVELLCSAGLPAVYTQVLILSDLPVIKYYAYLLLYIFFFILDDLLVFFIAMSTLKRTFINTRYTRYSNIIGGIIMFIIGVLLIFKPEWLMFG